MLKRYFCDGPNGYLYFDDLQEARRIVDLIDPEGDDWTITDLGVLEDPDALPRPK